MPMIEIDENELMQHRQLSGVAAKIMQHPEGKKLLEKAHKLVNPQAPTPTLDQEALLTQASNAALEKVKELEASLAAEKAEREKAEKLAQINNGIESGLKELRDAGWQDDGIKAVRDLMDEKGITDPLIAAAYIEKAHPPQAPVTPRSTGAWNFLEGVNDGEQDLQKLIESKGENTMLVDKMAFDALNDVRGQGRR